MLLDFDFCCVHNIFKPISLVLLPLYQNFFQLEERKVSIKSEFFAGITQFLACLYVLPVIPGLLIKCGYPSQGAYILAPLVCCVGSIILGLVSNIPFIVAPSTSGSIMHSVFLRQHAMNFHQGNKAVIVSGCLLIALGFRPLGQLFSRCVPGCIQASTAVGIGLLTSFAGCLETNIVVRGKYTALAFGEITHGE